MDDAAQAIVGDLGSCLRELEVNGNYFGRFSMTVVLYAHKHQAVDTAVAEAFKVFSTYDGVLLEERYNVLNAFLAIVPGNWAYNLRYMYLLNTNYADISFLFTLSTGERENKHLGAEYLAVLETNHGTPYFLNLHYQDRAHTIVLGATGAGKSFFLNFLLTNLQKYNPYTFIFDLGGSYEATTENFQGSYMRVGVEHRAFQINPFCLEPTKENLHFLFSFVKVLIESGDGGARLSNTEQKDLYDQISNLYEIDRENRRLSTLANIMPRHIAQHLARWIQGGAYAALFDNVEDTLSFARFQAFDFEGLDKYPQILEPLLFYVLHRANASIYAPELATTFKTFVMDEAWRFLENETIKQYITEALKTWRKRNAALIMATQSSDDLSRSDILRIIVESCATTIFLANPGMDQAVYRDIFHLNETESALVAELVPKKQALIKRPDMARVVNLNVDDTGYWLYTNSPVRQPTQARSHQEARAEEGSEGSSGIKEGIIMKLITNFLSVFSAVVPCCRRTGEHHRAGPCPPQESTIPEHGTGARTVQYGDKDVIAINSRLRFTTLIVLPKNEHILDFVCGDKDFWVVNGTENFAYVNPRRPTRPQQSEPHHGERQCVFVRARKR